MEEPVTPEPIPEDAAARPEEEAPSAEKEDVLQTPSASELTDDQIRSIMEVLLLVSDRPLSVTKIQEVMDGLQKPKIYEVIEQVRRHLTENGFPFQVREVANGYLLSTMPEFAPWVRKFYAPKLKTSKLSQAALETLAVIAYKQPITRAEIEAIRGVNIDSTLRTLVEKRLVEIVGYKDVIGKPATYGTTNDFLLQFGLKALSDLPTIEELRSLNSGP
ncbi:MAG: SMC-Scp complex subunit ScpB [Candidatus Abyssobacteria bacterium SURF_5]|uniref:SMC-Scp complex subunit ScpB n=1 Tax=Abyssobacteria bacterium (strain SURF_5) TaxID=2093360 RepID=A0A3A4NIE5_ABYX5|nr:MAG: SMC-Scp complex subunit ScpB [Candidatus Abyssubacteria bacterium SURF_5]